MYQELFKRIIVASQTESLVFFVGAGVSKLSDAPKWSELIDAFCVSLGRTKKQNLRCTHKSRVSNLVFPLPVELVRS